MSRWSWHPRHGVADGPILRISDTLTPGQLEEEIQREAAREYDWIEHHPANEPLFKDTRACYVCGDEKAQHDMRWVGKSWACPKHYQPLG